MYLRTMNDRELITHLRATDDDLTRSEAEREMLDRFERLVDAAEESAPFTAVLDSFEIDADALRLLLEAHPAEAADMAAMLAQLHDADIHDADSVTAVLQIADQMQQIANDRGDVLTALIELFNHPYLNKE
ncbi:MAG: hypothetical protein DWQ11_18710 [Proteobacteria bacterium]|nr:MAG: hypothetical protein DWQ11_18710 [Pseudomonadota bacterium]